MLPMPVNDCSLPMAEDCSPSPPPSPDSPRGDESHTGRTSVSPTFVIVKTRLASWMVQKTSLRREGGREPRSEMGSITMGIFGETR